MSLILSGTDGLSDVDGSAATPAIRGTDANTGIFFPAADTIAFAEGGAECARFNSSGNFGLGVTPSAWTNYTGVLQMTGGSLAGYTGGDYLELIQNGYYASGSYKYVQTGYASKYQQNTGTHQWYVAASGSANATIAYTQAMTLNANGVLALQGASTSANGIGITFPATQSASSNANTLDDYEEGTWTATITNVVGSYTLTTVNYAQYTKIGQMVYGFLSVTVTTSGTASDSMNFTLPFVPAREGSGTGRENVSSGDILISRIVTGGSGEGRLYKTSGAAAGAGAGTYVVSFMFLT